jgi:hypothetical protein
MSYSGTTLEGAMGYQINALFEDGSIMVSGLIKASTPPLNTTFEVFRGNQIVRGNVVKIRPLRVVTPHGPTTTVDEVHFREIIAVVPVAAPKTFSWVSGVARLKAFFGARAKAHTRVGQA